MRVIKEQTVEQEDGAYSGADNEALAEEKNITLVTTNLTGRGAADIMADFEFSEDGMKLLKCAGSFEPKSCSYNSHTGQCTVSFQRSQCENCPHRDQCKPKVFKRVCRKNVSQNTMKSAEQQRYRSSEEFSKLSKFRSGVETIASILRRKYNIESMPV